MAKVLIKEGLILYEENSSKKSTPTALTNTEGFRSSLEAQEPKRLKGAPKRLRLYKP